MEIEGGLSQSLRVTWTTVMIDSDMKLPLAMLESMAPVIGLTKTDKITEVMTQ